MKRIMIFLLLLFVSAASLAQTVNIWKDESGDIYYGDSSPSLRMSHIGKAITYKTKKTVNTSASKTPVQNKKQPKIIMYSAVWCGYCKKARDYFTKNKVKFTEYDVETNPVGIAFYSAMSRKSVPIFNVDGEIQWGFSVKMFDKLLNKT